MRTLQGFNKEIEEITKIQKAFAIPDPELRDKLKRDNKQFVLPTYAAFLNKYAKVNFTKNPEKYVKYSERDVTAFIDQFFDASAQQQAKLWSPATLSSAQQQAKQYM